MEGALQTSCVDEIPGIFLVAEHHGLSVGVEVVEGGAGCRGEGRGGLTRFRSVTIGEGALNGDGRLWVPRASDGGSYCSNWSCGRNRLGGGHGNGDRVHRGCRGARIGVERYTRNFRKLTISGRRSGNHPSGRPARDA